MRAQILILKGLWKKLTNVDDPRVTLGVGFLLILEGLVIGGFLIFLNALFYIIMGIAFFVVTVFLGMCMFCETRRLNRIKKDKGYWFWWLKPTYVNKMHYSDFEECIAWIYTMQGYKCKVLRKYSHEHGADVLAFKGDEVIAIQAKRWQKKVGINAVDQVLKTLAHYNPTKLVVITNSQFTKPAYECAKNNNVQLIDGDKLLSLYKRAQEIYENTYIHHNN